MPTTVPTSVLAVAGDQATSLADSVDLAISRTRDYLLAAQQTDGHWCAELEGDSILESEYILLQAFLGRLAQPRVKKVARSLADQQTAGGGWTMYPGGPVEVSASVKAYFALKLVGHDPESEPMCRARAAILSHGGADAVNSFTRFYLAFLGQISYKQCPAVPPEVSLLPTWLPINLYAMSAWSRAMVVTLALIWTKKPVTEVPANCGISELFINPPETWPMPRCPGKAESRSSLNWEWFFLVVDSMLKKLESRGLMLLRTSAARKCQRWMLERFADSAGLGAIFPPMVWSMVALRALGYADESREMQYCTAELEELVVETPDEAWLQPCKSPVWDTAISLRALDAAEVSIDDLATARGVDWLLANEIRQTGDWRRTVRAEPAGWCFEYANAFYPDIDDTAMVMMALSGVERATAPCQRAERWVRAMQNRDGGWGAFDRDNDREFLCKVPFADHNAMIDPSTPDLTGRVLEALGMCGHRSGDATVDRAVTYLRRTQETDGCWFGRWGVNYIYGTWQSLVGLAAIGMPTSDPTIVRAAKWLIQHQQACGGWGESCDTYADPSLRGQGDVTASQTAWAVWGLIAAGQAWHPAVERGVRYLLDTQRTNGTWDEVEFTGTGFPQVFYLRYHYYPINFPLLALGFWRQATAGKPAR
jgi:squalene-hopene/tetraprenyl-beta-curcumene cyclase